MAQPQMARITCTECNSWYESERELRDHMQTAHRRFVSEPSVFQNDSTQPDGLQNRVGTPVDTSKEE